MTPLIWTDLHEDTAWPWICSERRAHRTSAKMCQVVPSCAKLCQVVPSCAKLCQVVPSCAKLCQVVPSCAKLCQVVPSCAKLCQVVPSCAKLCQVVPMMTFSFPVILLDEVLKFFGRQYQRHNDEPGLISRDSTTRWKLKTSGTF